MSKAEMFDFDALVTAIRQVHEHLAAQAGRAVNTSLTLRNWAIGCYIREYEQKGADRAKYGKALLQKLSATLLENAGIRYHPRELGRCREFYTAYPTIGEPLSSRFEQMIPATIRQVLSAESHLATLANRGTVTPELSIPPEDLVKSLSYSHFAELLSIEEPLKRTFYEVECIRGNWSVRELKRQIASLYFERSGLSLDKEKLASMVKAGVETAEPRLAIRDPYVFEFLGIKPREVMSESNLEDRLLDKLEDFLLELGQGFCFETRQQRILIGDTYSFVDLVFYHRILKCHLLVDLKIETFNHENIGQLNTYVSWYRKHMMAGGDNPPVGLLLCTRKDHALVEYALAGMDNQLFVSRYQLELPSKDDIRRFLEEKVREIGEGRAG
jgi:predicted nuclease of restriction endonuclease-like (RecB) superfamily